MIIATKQIDFDKVISLHRDQDGLNAYVRSLIPSRVAHVDAIYHNTRFYICYMIMQRTDVKLDVKQALSKLLTRNIRVVGYTEDYIAIEELERYVNMKQVNKYREGDLYGKGGKLC